VCAELAASLRHAGTAGHALPPTVRGASEALERTRVFLSEKHEPAGTAGERAHLAGVLHALDHASRLTERTEDWASEPRSEIIRRDAETTRAASLAAAALDRAVLVARAVAAPRRPAESELGMPGVDDSVGAMARADAAEAGALSRSLSDLQRSHRARILAAAAHGESGVTAAEAIDRSVAVRLLDKLAYHAWRSAAHLLGAEDVSVPEPQSLAIRSADGRGGS